MNYHCKKVGFKPLFLLFLLFFQVSMFAQNSVRISIKNDRITVKEALKEIEKQSKLSVAYNESKLDADKQLSLNLTDVPLEKALSDVLSGSTYSYQVKDGYIMIVPEKNARSQTKTVTGRIVDENGEPLIGCAVSVQGTTTGTTADMDGKFSLNVAVGDVLNVSFMGYTTQYIKVGEKSDFAIALQPLSKILDDVVVTALGIKRSEKALSYNAQKIGNEDISTVKDANFMNSLAGKVAGLTINASSTGVGGATKVVLRGSKSIERDNNVLYVIDGIPMINFSRGGLEESAIYSLQPSGGEGIGDLNPDDIESMTVLSGPSAAALYGASAANGAIVINTKKGAEGKAKISYSNQTTFMQPFVLPEFQHKYGNTPGTYESWGDVQTTYNYKPKDFFNTGSNVQNTIALSVGSQYSQTYVSASTTNANGIIPNNNYNKYNFTLRNTTKFFNEKMFLDMGFNYIIQDNRNMTAQGLYFNPLVAVYTFPRGEDFDNIRLYEERQGDLNAQRWKWSDQTLNLQNPYWTAYRNLFETNRKRYIANINLSYEIYDWLSVGGRVKVDNTNSVEEKKLYATTNTTNAGVNGSYFRKVYAEDQVYADFMVNINKYFAHDISLSANIGTSILDQKLKLTGGNGNLRSDALNLFALNNIDLRDGKTQFIEDGWKQQTQSIFANVELGWKNMLYLTLTGRNDWDSALANMPDKSFIYPSVGLSAVISEMVNLPEFFNYLKLRTSYASVGNSIPRNISVSHYSFDPGSGGWATKTYRPVDKLYPERTNSYEAGLNMRFWKNRFELNATLYHSNTLKQTITVPVSSGSGYNSIIAQTGNIRNRGIELSLSFNEKWNDLGWTSSLMASTNRNKIIELGSYLNEDNIDTKLSTIEKTSIGSTKIILTEGGTLGDIWSTLKVKRDENGDIYVDPQTGGISTESELRKIGNVLPKWNFGWSNSFNWKDFNFGFVITARVGGDVISYTQAILDGFGVTKSTADVRDAGGVAVNNGTVSAKDWFKVVGGTSGVYSHYVYSASNVRLQEASMGYTLPSRWFNNKAKASVSLVGRNLFMIYNKAPFDPEATASTGNYYQGLDYFMSPSLRSIGFSIKVDF